MKNLYTIIVLLILSISPVLAQDTINEPFLEMNGGVKININPDSVFHDLTDGQRDDTDLYYERGDRDEGDTLPRLIYFVHGLGGNIESWKGSYRGLDDEYYYEAKKMEYYQSQQDFDHATYEVYDECAILRGAYETKFAAKIADTAYEFPPYAIGHSQGGLVLRDMDMKHHPDDIQSNTLDSTNRLFWGIVTFNTPHAGAYMAVRQEDLAALGGDIGTTLFDAAATTTIGGLALDHPLFKNLIFDQTKLVDSIISMIKDKNFIENIFLTIAADSNDPISKQFGPESTYLLDTINQHINPQMPKAVFYGAEEEPVMWRLLHFMLNEPTAYAAFEANEDDALMETIDEIRLKMKTTSIYHDMLAAYHYNNYSNTIGIWGSNPVGLFVANNHLQDALLHQDISDANFAGADILSKSNMLYKTILGSIDDSYVTLDTVNWFCKKTIEVTSPSLPLFGVITSTYNHYQIINDPLQCDNTLPTTSNLLGIPGNSPTYASFNTYTVINTQLTPITEETMYEIPSDGTVLVPSQMAFPGCLDIHKRLLNERFNHTTGQFETVPVPKVNHLQVRNCEETEAAMRRLYEGDGSMPDFFKLEKK